MKSSLPWERIVLAAGQPFQTVRGMLFTYNVSGNTLRASRADRNLHRSQFERAWGLCPLRNVAQLQYQVQGPSYVFAILTDPRICGEARRSDANC
jgi:hypothetical protein